MTRIFNFLSLIILLSLPLFSVNAAANSLTMATYYPSPTGHYDKISANNIGIGTFDPLSDLDVNGDAAIKGDAVIKGDVVVRGGISADTFKTSGASSVMTIILSDQTGVVRTCPKGYQLIGQWVTSNGGGPFVTIDSLGNKIPEGNSGVMGMCSSI